MVTSVMPTFLTLNAVLMFAPWKAAPRAILSSLLMCMPSSLSPTAVLSAFCTAGTLMPPPMSSMAVMSAMPTPAMSRARDTGTLERENRSPHILSNSSLLRLLLKSRSA